MRSRVSQRSRVGGMQQITGVLDRVVERKGWKRSFDKARLLAAWDDAVGHQLARTTKAIEFRKNRESKETIMVIRVQDNTAASFFSLNTPLYLAKLQEVLGSAAPTQLQFTVGLLEKTSKTVKHRTIKLTLAEQKRIAQSLENTPENIRNTLQSVAEALARARLERLRNGFVPCPICETLTEKPQPCAHCRITLRSPLAAQWRSKIIRNPDLLLNHTEPDEIMNCAKFLALEYLQGQLEALALQILAQNAPEMRFYLELTAKAYLALRLEQPLSSISPKEWRHLPERIRGVLEA
ncbi:MAG: hypothetical protein RLZZ156_850 [Deinococcota bacterium]|jgi:hypothetical protein